ncbi:MAG: hypothetical protein GY839_09105 [candidate division Zixibacteria bacterium]|nr:hypothetical protein [candidate division Zixibacteria bacterium]
MTKKQHIKAGIITGIVVNYGLKWLVRNDLSVGLIYSIILGIIGEILPDILEPPTSRWHRKLWHSKKMIMYMALLVLVLLIIPLLKDSMKAGIVIVLISYLIHLILDSRTPAGLP